MSWMVKTRLIMRLKPVEFLMLQVIAALIFLNAILVAFKGTALDIPGYIGVISLALMLLGVGYFYRLTGRSERIGYAMIGTGIFMYFMMFLGMFNYLLLPVRGETLDAMLVSIDAMFGYHWPDVMAFASEYPTASFILKLAYMSTTPQLAILLIILGLSGKIHDLHEMLLLITITAVLTVCFWAVFPSSGPSALYTLPAEVWAGISPTVGAEYGALLNELRENGPTIISPGEIRGLIAFPSYHAVLAFVAAYCARNVKYVSIVFLIVNLLILPSIFIHGGHHLVDLPAGLAMFLFGLWLAKRTMRVYEDAPNPAVRFAT